MHTIKLYYIVVNKIVVWQLNEIVANDSKMEMVELAKQCLADSLANIFTYVKNNVVRFLFSIVPFSN